MSDLARLLERLTPTSRAALERAAETCAARGAAAIEIEHLLAELAADAGSDLARALGAFGIDTASVAHELAAAVARAPAGATRTPGLGAGLVTALEQAWVTASIDLALPQVNSACVLAAAVSDTRVREAVLRLAPSLSPMPRQALADALPALIAAGREGPGAGPADAGAVEAALERFTVDLTARARAGELDPVLGREAEIDRLVEILMRRRQNSPLLVGEPGVGKTAIVEGLAQRIASDEAPATLAGMSLLALDLPGLLAGEDSPAEHFAARFRGLLRAAQAEPGRRILFIDEAHMLVGLGGPAGMGDAATLLKPTLARGGLRMVAATTYADHKRHFESDPAFARRFQPVHVAPPTAAETVTILRGLAPRLEDFHQVRVLEEALGAAAQLSQRYLTERRLPDKAISVLDTACARVAIAQSAPPPAVAEAERRCRDLEAELARRRAEGADAERLDALAESLDAAVDTRHRLESRWRQERATLARIRDVEAAGDAEGDPLASSELGGLYLELAAVQETAPLVPVAVDRRAIAEVVAAWTGVPITAMLGDAPLSAAQLQARLAERVVGQDVALAVIARRLQAFQAGLSDAGKPAGVFLLCGPSGVGKTETALGLAELLYGGPRALITVNMTEYQEAHAVSGLKGAPPGYVGYGKGGVLTEAVRRQPYSVVLLDEVEKAHPDVMELFYQVFDRGVLEDSDGLAVDFTNTVILLTSNLGSGTLAAWPPSAPRTAEAATALRAELLQRFPPAFLGRLVVVPYFPLGATELQDVVRLKLGRIQARFNAVQGAELTYAEPVVGALARRAGGSDAGARRIDTLLADELLPLLSDAVLARRADDRPLVGVHVGLARDGGLDIGIDG